MDDILYKNNEFTYAYRVGAIIYNKEKNKVLLFYGNDMNYFMIPGGKVKELETSEQAIIREIKEEIGYENLNFDFAGVSEEIVEKGKVKIQQLTLIYKCVYEGVIEKEIFKSIESDWINFKWINIEEVSKIELHPKQVEQIILNEKNHVIEKTEDKPTDIDDRHIRQRDEIYN